MTVLSSLMAFARELLVATVVPISTISPSTHFTARPVPASTQPNPTIVVPSAEIPHGELFDASDAPAIPPNK
mgnify:CR=1 FL=1